MILDTDLENYFQSDHAAFQKSLYIPTKYSAFFSTKKISYILNWPSNTY